MRLKSTCKPRKGLGLFASLFASQLSFQLSTLSSLVKPTIEERARNTISNLPLYPTRQAVSFTHCTNVRNVFFFKTQVNSLAENVTQIIEFQNGFCSEIQQLLDYEEDFKNINEIGLFQVYIILTNRKERARRWYFRSTWYITISLRRISKTTMSPTAPDSPPDRWKIQHQLSSSRLLPDAYLHLINRRCHHPKSSIKGNTLKS